MKYNYLIVGAGLYGAAFAQQAREAGKSVLVIDKRPQIAGNVYTRDVEGIHVHQYGAHIFHTNNKEVWDYVNRFATFNRFTNSPVANYHGELFSLPFNMYTFNKMWGVVTPEEAAAKIEEQKRHEAERYADDQIEHQYVAQHPLGRFVVALAQAHRNQRRGAHAHQRTERRGEVHQREGQRKARDGQRPDPVADEDAVDHVVQRRGRHGDNGRYGILCQQLADALGSKH